MHAKGATTSVLIRRWSSKWLRSPELAIAAFAGYLQWRTLRPVLGPFIYADELGYVAAARFLWPGGEDPALPSNFFHPGYGLLLSPLTAVFDEPASFHRAATTLNGLMLVAAAVLAARLARRLHSLGPGSTVLVGGLFAASTSVMVSSGLVWAESTLTLLVVLLAVVARRLGEHGRRLDLAALAMLGVAAYAVHPRAIAITAAVAITCVAFGWSRQRRADAAIALIGIGIGFLAVRQLNAFVADNVYAGNVLDGTNASFSARLRELILEAPGPWTRGLIGTAWYQLLASAGLGAVAVVGWGRSAVGLLSGRQSKHDGSGLVALSLIMASLLGWLIAATITSGEEVRIDHTVYGRYLDHIGPLALCLGAAMIIESGARATRPVLASAVLVPLGGWVLSLWWGFDFYTEQRLFVRVNAPVFASMSEVLESTLPGLIGLVAGAAILAFWALLRSNQQAGLIAALVGLVGLGGFTVRNEVWPYSRDVVNLQAMADATEQVAPNGTVLLARPMAFLNLYGGQFWADDVSFVLGSQCPASAYDYVIASIDDPRYADHRVVFEDDRSDRQLLEPPSGAHVLSLEAQVLVEQTLISGASTPAVLVVTNTGSEPLEVPGTGPRTLAFAYRIIDVGTEPNETPPVVVAWTGVLEPDERIEIPITFSAQRDGGDLASGSYTVVADLYVDRVGWLREAGCDVGLPPGRPLEVLD